MLCITHTIRLLFVSYLLLIVTSCVGVTTGFNIVVSVKDAYKFVEKKGYFDEVKTIRDVSGTWNGTYIIIEGNKYKILSNPRQENKQSN